MAALPLLQVYVFHSATLKAVLSANEKLKHLEEHGFQQKPTQKMRDKVQGLRSVGGNIRDTVMAKPKQFAHKLRHKFGSADNLTSIGNEGSKDESRPGGGSSSLPR